MGVEELAPENGAKREKTGSPPDRPTGGARSSVTIMVCTLLSRLLGIVKARAISGVFGASGTADVINFTFNIPNSFRKLFAEGALTSAYIPVFAANIQDDPERLTESRKLMAALIGFQVLLFIPLVAVTWLCAPRIVSFLSDFSDPSQIRLSAGLLGWFMIFLATISIGSIFNGMLQCHGSFFTAAAAPLLFSLSVIGSVLYASRYIGAYSMALGTVVGGVLQAGCSYVRLRRYGYRLRVSFNFKSSSFLRVMAGWWPVTVTALVAVISQQVAFYFASSLPEGSITAFNNAIIFWQTPYGIFFTAISTVFFPLMSRHYHADDKVALADSIAKGLQYLATFLVPSAILLIALRDESVSAVLQTGRFTVADTLLTADVLFWYLLGMLFVAWYGYLQRYCYSIGRYVSTLIVSIAVAVIDIAATWFLIERGSGIVALPIANSLSYLVGFIILYMMAVLPLQEFSHAGLLLSVGKILLANIPLAAACAGYKALGLVWWQNGSTLMNLLRLAGLFAVAMAVVLVSYLVCRIEFISVLLRRRKG